MGGHVRVGEEDEVLGNIRRLPQDIWWIVVYIDDNGDLKYRYFLSSAKANLKSLKEFLEDLKERNTKMLIFAVWHGRQLRR